MTDKGRTLAGLAIAAIAALCATAGGATSVPAPPLDWPEKTLLEYGSTGEATLEPRGVIDGLTVRRDGTAIVVLYDYPRRSVRRACLGERRVQRLRNLLERAARLDEDLETRPYPRRGEQHLRFGRNGKRSLNTWPDPNLPAMTGRLRRKVFRAVDAIRIKARRSDRRRRCAGSYGSRV